jgi:error-prone DNA polymerase
VEIRPVDVNHSCWDCTLEAGAVRLGLRMLRGLGERAAIAIEQARCAGPFRSLEDFSQRTKLNPATVHRLARADAFGSLALDRRQSLWRSLGQRQEVRPLFEDADFFESDEELAVSLPAMDPRDEVLADYQTAGLSLKAHPVSFYRTRLTQLKVLPAAELANRENGQFVRVGGLVLVRQRPGTAKGITFVTLEDETGQANLIIRMDVWERFYKVARTATAFIAHGRLQKQEQVIHVLVTKLENMAIALRSQSRDFH